LDYYGFYGLGRLLVGAKKTGGWAEKKAAATFATAKA